MPDTSPLRILHASIQQRCAAIAASHFWPCREGCGHCCRRLSGIPTVTLPEWQLLWTSYAQLTPTVREEIRRRLQHLAPPAPYTCPFLDLQADRCRVYESRPIACRTYGFYVDRGTGLYCREMLARAGQGEWDDVILGNAASVEASLLQWGEQKDLKQWFAYQDA